MPVKIVRGIFRRTVVRRPICGRFFWFLETYHLPAYSHISGQLAQHAQLLDLSSQNTLSCLEWRSKHSARPLISGVRAVSYWSGPHRPSHHRIEWVRRSSKEAWCSLPETWVGAATNQSRSSVLHHSTYRCRRGKRGEWTPSGPSTIL